MLSKTYNEKDISTYLLTFFINEVVHDIIWTILQLKISTCGHQLKLSRLQHLQGNTILQLMYQLTCQF